jgi:hypothetical protein
VAIGAGSAGCIVANRLISASRTLVTSSHELGAPYSHIFLTMVMQMVRYSLVGQGLCITTF